MAALSPRPNPKFKPGDAVVLWSDSTDPNCEKEYGRVLYLVWHPVIEGWDAHVAFFGTEWPSKELESKPYVLRYFDTTLRPFTPPENTDFI